MQSKSSGSTRHGFASHSRTTAGSGDSTIGPAVITIPAPSTASRADAAATAPSGSVSIRRGSGSNTVTVADGLSAWSSARCARPCSPKPRMAARDQPSGAKCRTQTPLAAAVRTAVISPASMIARAIPVAASFTIIRPVMYGSPSA
jgi:hypothetical protein